MSESFSSLSAGELRQVDEICESYEAKVRRGDELPQIGRITSELRDSLKIIAQRELVRIRLDGQAPGQKTENMSVLLAECPELGALLDEFGAHETTEPTIAKPISTRSSEDADSDHAVTQTFLGGVPSMDGRDIRQLSLPDYELFETLGRGGMGTVFKARQKSLDRDCAVKMISNLHLASQGEVDRFTQEAKLAAHLQHPGIVQIFDYGETNGTPYFSMELISGKGLDSVARDGTLKTKQAAVIVEQVARAVAYAHREKVLHRDLKPSNVLLEEDGTPKITDFGLARSLAADAAMTAQGEVLGTPSYMSPEQASGRFDQVDVRSDVYSLGAILFELLVGRPPFRGETPLATLEQVQTIEVIPPIRLNPDVDRDLDTICLKCLDKRPEKRYSTAEELAEDLQRYVSGHAIQARRIGTAGRVKRWAGRNPGLAMLGSALAASLLIGIISSTGLAAWALDRADLAYGETRRANGLARATQIANQEIKTKAKELSEQLDANRIKTIEISKRTALLAGQRGDWEQALLVTENALEMLQSAELGSLSTSSDVDPIWFQLQRLVALNALFRRDDALAELDRLKSIPDLGPYEGQVTLWEGDLALIAGNSGDDPLEIIQNAIDQGLPPAQELYAKGLLTENTTEAVDYFLQSLEIEPYNQSVLAHACIFETLLGRHNTARDRAKVGMQLFPDDPSFPYVMAVSYGIQGDLEKSQQFLTTVEDVYGPVAKATTVEALKAWGTFSALLTRFDRLTLLDHAKLTFISLKMKTLLLTRANGTLSVADRTPKSLHDVFTALLGFLMTQNASVDFEKRRDAAEKLAETVKSHPEAFLYFFTGIALISVGELEKAEPYLIEATELPALFEEVRSEAIFWAFKTATELHFRDPSPDKLQHAMELAQRTNDFGPLPPEHLGEVALLLAHGGKPVDGWLLAEDIFRQNPDSEIARRVATQLTVKAAMVQRGLSLADSILEEQPEDTQVLEWKNALLAMVDQDVDSNFSGAELIPSTDPPSDTTDAPKSDGNADVSADDDSNAGQ